MVELGGSEAARTRAPHSAVAGGRLRGWSAMTGHGQSVTHVPGIKRNLCVQNGPRTAWLGREDSNLRMAECSRYFRTASTTSQGTTALPGTRTRSGFGVA